jgi:hypothetical protein
MQALPEILGRELNRLVGPRYRHDDERDMVPGGTTPTTVVLGGRMVHVRRPRRPCRAARSLSLHDGRRGPPAARALAAKLQDEYPGAAASLREGADDLFAVADLAITGKLLRFLQTTNAIENPLSSFRHVSRNVKRRRSGSMISRWAAIAMTYAGRKFRKARGHDDLRLLAVALKPMARKEALGACGVECGSLPWSCSG